MPSYLHGILKHVITLYNIPNGSYVPFGCYGCAAYQWPPKMLNLCSVMLQLVLP